mmetsp:Transcript_37890/g.114443  ORF Transcript_37890/g.114443 Transcript_37890/m.114443 type:complete len:211 (+) Transcript_37890:1209-1841(+)
MPRDVTTQLTPIAIQEPLSPSNMSNWQKSLNILWCKTRFPNQQPTSKDASNSTARKNRLPVEAGHWKTNAYMCPRPGKCASICESFTGSSKKRSMSSTKIISATNMRAQGWRHRTRGLVSQFHLLDKSVPKNCEVSDTIESSLATEALASSFTGSQKAPLSYLRLPHRGLEAQASLTTCPGHSAAAPAASTTHTSLTPSLTPALLQPAPL